MKILFFIETLNSGGKERRMVELIKGLASNPSIEMELVLTSDKNIHYDDIFETNIKIHYTIRKRWKKDPRVFLKFYSIAKKFRPDIIHVWGNLVAIYAIPAKVFLKIPMINNQISDAPSEMPKSILSHKMTFPYSDRIIANSHAGLVAYNAPKDKSSVIYNGFNFKRLDGLLDVKDIRSKFNIKTKLVVGMIANFSNRKDYKSYITAANNILKKNNDVTFLCVGAGDTTGYVDLVDSDNKETILFLGKQANVESIMNACDIGVLATYTEGISNALLEFSALGKPVVTTFGGGNVELVAQDETGYLVAQSSPDALAEKIEILLDNDEKRMNFGAEGKKRIMTVFSIEQMISAFTNAYTELISESKK